MLDVSLSYNRYKFLGFEFLTWLWFMMDNDQEELRKIDKDLDSLFVGNRIVLENQLHDTKETVTIKGDDIGLEEGILALKKGAVVTEISIVYGTGDYEWRFSVKGENLNLANLKPPETGPLESAEDIEGVLLEKVYLYEKAIGLMDTIYNHFLKLRLSEDWANKAVPKMKNWIGKG